MNLPPELLQDNAIPSARTVLSSGLSKLLLGGFCESEEMLHFIHVRRTSGGEARSCGLAVLLDDVNVDDKNGAEAHVVGEPKRLNENLLLRKVVDQIYDALCCLDTLLYVGADHGMPVPWSATQVGEIAQEK